MPRISRVLVGHVPVFSRKLIVADPATLDDFVPNRRRKKPKRDFSYAGSCAAAETRLRAAELMDGAGQPVAIVTKAPKNRNYPVYALVRESDGKVVRLVIVLDGDPCSERPKESRSKRRRRD